MSKRGPGTGSMPAPVPHVLAMAGEEAERDRHGCVGVEHPLVALSREESRWVPQLLADHGVTTSGARDAVRLVVGSGHGDGPRLDARTLLGTLGIDLDDLDEVR